MFKTENNETRRLRVIYESIEANTSTENAKERKQKRRYLNSAQLAIQSLEITNSTEFLRDIGKIGVGKDKTRFQLK